MVKSKMAIYLIFKKILFIFLFLFLEFKVTINYIFNYLKNLNQIELKSLILFILFGKSIKFKNRDINNF